MSPHADTNWWDFTIESNERSKSAARIQGDRKVNPEIPAGLSLLDYHEYVGLDKLLECQVPSSRIPDERIFIITHQLFELVFKQMIFDLAVVTKTLEALLNDDESLKRHCPELVAVEELKSDEEAVERFWRPALHASGRLKYSSKQVLPTILKYVDKTSGSGNDSLELFNSDEFKEFRDYLIPASGFQTAQFRLIGRALGKSNLLEVRLFPSSKYQKAYLGEGDNLPVSLADSLILRKGFNIANPPAGSTWAKVSELDSIAHAVLSRISLFSPDKNPASTNEAKVKVISTTNSSISELTTSYRDMFERIQSLVPGRNIAEDEIVRTKALAKFEETWTAAALSENRRREMLSLSRLGAYFCKTEKPQGYLTRVLDRIVETDRELHGYSGEMNGASRNKPERAGFLMKHFQTASSQIGGPDSVTVGGTGGGGTPYLKFSVAHLFHQFPALVHYEDLLPVEAGKVSQGQ